MPPSFGKRVPSQAGFDRPAPIPYAPAFAINLETAPTGAIDAHPPKWPRFTIALSVALGIVFAVQVQLAGGIGSIGFPQAISFGGIDRYLVIDQQQWWRAFTAQWLHNSSSHLIGNLITLIVAGAVLERHIGTAWLAAVYLLGGIGGSIGSMVVNDARMISMGASGAIIALVTMVYALSYHASLAGHAKKLRWLALYTLIPAIAPSAANSDMIDVGAHFGGFLVGIVCAFLLLILWDEEAPMPGYRDLAASAAIVVGAVLALASVELYVQYPAAMARMAALTPTAILHNDDAVARDAVALELHYPHDPALRVVLGISALKAARYSDAAAEARAGLAEREVLLASYPRSVDETLQGVLALALLGEGRRADAKDAAQPVCWSQFGKVLIGAGLCD